MPSIHLPDLVLLCGSHFELRANRHCRKVTHASEEWVQENIIMDEDEREAFPGLHVGLLTSLCYPTCDVGQLRLVTDFMSLLIHWSSVSLASAERPFQQIWTQLQCATAENWQTRFQDALDAFRSAQERVMKDNALNIVPDENAFIMLRRDSSGIRMMFDLIEYAEGLHIPEGVHNIPVFNMLKQDALDIVCWSNDLVAYNSKQAQGDQHNLVTVLMLSRELGVQAAVEFAGSSLKGKIESFLTNATLLLAAGEDIRAAAEEDGRATIEGDIRVYVQGLRNWIIGHVHWIYETERYFGTRGDEVRSFGWVFLIKKEPA